MWAIEPEGAPAETELTEEPDVQRSLLGYGFRVGCCARDRVNDLGDMAAVLAVDANERHQLVDQGKKYNAFHHLPTERELFGCLRSRDGSTRQQGSQSLAKRAAIERRLRRRGGPRERARMRRLYDRGAPWTEKCP